MEAQEDSDLRKRALERLKKKRDFAAHVVTYLAVNGFIIAIWAFTSDGGFFWPIFPIGGWGIGLFFHGWDVYYGGPTEDDITREMNRLAHRDR
jgi:hypothetical protein